MNLPNSSLAALAVSQLWQVTVVILAVALITRLACRRRPHLTHLLWMLVLAKAITPPVLSTDIGLFQWVPWPPLVSRAEQQPAWNSGLAVAGSADYDLAAAGPPEDSTAAEPGPVQHAETGTRLRAELTKNPAGPRRRSHSPGTGLDLAAWILSCWLAGAVLAAAIVLVKLLFFHVTVRRSSLSPPPQLQRTLDQLRGRLGIRRPVSVIVCRRAHVPSVCGLLRPRIVVSQDLVQRASPQQMEMTLAHELIHVRRADLYWGLLQVASQIVWWFHPLVWWANRQASSAIEACCDQEVLHDSVWEPASYARCLLELGRMHQQAKWAPGLPGMRPFEITRRRLEYIVQESHRLSGRTPWHYWLLTSAAALLILPGAGTSGASDDSRTVGVALDTPPVAAAEGAGLALETAAGQLADFELTPADRGVQQSVPPLVSVWGQARLSHWNAAHPLGFTPFGELVSSSDDGRLCYWQLPAGERSAALRLPPSLRDRAWGTLGADQLGRLHSEALLSRDGRLLLLGRADGTIRVYDGVDRRLVRTLQVPGGWVTGLTLSADGSRIAARRVRRQEGEPSLVVLDSSTGAVLSEIKEPARQPAVNATWKTAALSADGSLLATATKEFVLLWDVATRRQLYTFEHRAGERAFTVWALAFHPDGQTLTTASAGGHVKFWDLARGTERLELQLQGTVRSLAFDPSGKFLATATRQIRLWDAASGELVWTTPRSDRHRHRGLAFNSSGELLAVGAGHQLLVFATASGQLVAPNHSRAGLSTCVAVSPVTEQLAIGDSSGRLTIWNYLEGREVLSWQSRQSTVSHLTYSPDGQLICSAGASGEKLLLWDASSGAFARELDERYATRHRVAFSDDGLALAAKGGNKPARIWDLTSGQVRGSLPPGIQLRHFEPLQFGPADTLFGTARGSLFQWNMASGQLVRKFDLKTRRGGRRRFAVSPDGTRVAGGVLGGSITVWDLSADVPNRRPAALRTSVQGGSIVWDLAAESKLQLVDGHLNRYLHDLCFSRDGRWLASAGEDGKVQLWNPRSGKLVRTIQLGPGRGIIDELFFGAGDRHLVTVNSNGTIYILDL